MPRTFHGRGWSHPAATDSCVVSSSLSKRHQAMVHAELLLLDDEINPVITVALKSGLEVTGLGATLLFEQPRLLTVNVTGEGEYTTLGQALRKALDEARRVRGENASLQRHSLQHRRSRMQSIPRHSMP